MKTEKYIDYELAKEIFETAKENDYKLPESEYFWVEKTGLGNPLEWGGRNMELASIQWLNRFPSLINYPAYDTYELGEILSKYCDGTKSIWIYTEIGKELDSASMFINELESRGKMFLYLLKNGLLL